MSVLLTGLSTSMLLFLLAAGLTLVFGMLGVTNFAHGSLYMLGAYLGFQVVEWTHSFWLAVILAPLIVGAVGGILEYFTLRPLYTREPHQQLLLTFGYILVIEGFARYVWGVNFKSVRPPAMFAGTSEIFGSTVTDYRLFIIFVGAFLSIALFYIIERSRIGIIVRAASSNSAMVSTLGIDVSKVRTGVFIAGAMLAAISGVISAPLLPLQLGLSFPTIIDCFMVIVLGGLGSVRGAILGALLIGMTRAVGQQFAANWIFLFSYALLIGALLLRPEGLLSFRSRTA